MKVKIIVGNAAYAVIQHGTVYLDVKLEPGMGAPLSLQLTAAEYRRKAAKLSEEAEVMELAAAHLESHR